MLKITRLADYAVLIICSFDTCKDKIVSSQEIINKTGLQKATVNKVLSILVRKKILEAHRGVNGGYKPFKKLEDISVKDLIEAVEGPVSLTDCIDNNARNCNLFDVCITKHTWSVVNSAVRDTLESIKVKDISSTKNSNKLLSFI
jgi:FeS assembly SUF system regulator